MVSNTENVLHSNPGMSHKFFIRVKWSCISDFVLISKVGGGSNPIFAHGKMCVFPFSPWGKMGKKVYGKRGNSIHFPLFPYTFFPFFPMGKNGKHTFFHGQKWGWAPPPKVACNSDFILISKVKNVLEFTLKSKLELVF